MIATSFAALTLSDLNNGTTTFAVTADYDHKETLPRLVETIGGYFDTRGTQASRLKPMRRTIRYLYVGSTATALDSHINTLEFTDLGKKGTLTLTALSATTYTCTAVLEKVAVRKMFDTNDQTTAEIILTVQELTSLV